MPAFLASVTSAEITEYVALYELEAEERKEAEMRREAAAEAQRQTVFARRSVGRR